jgi:sigma-B regulation protein RsbU (phosphoserine phosphatase)
MAHLRLSSTDGPTEILPLRGDRLVIGRSRECDLILPDVLLSRRHAEIATGADGWVIRDLGSMNGTRLNEERIEGERPLADGDVVQVAGWRLAFLEGDPSPLAEHTPGHGDRVHDITSLATRSGIELGGLARQGRLLGVLTRSAGVMVTISTADQLLDTLLAHLLDAIPARRGAVALLDHDPTRANIVATRPGEEVNSMTIDPGVADRVRMGGTALLAPRVASEDGTVVRSVLCAPMWFTGSARGADRVVGLVALEGPADPTPFEDAHLGLVTAVVNLAASRLESIRLREETADKHRLEEDLRGAARIQASLLPEEQPVMDGWDIGGSSRQCSAVGADYYDFALDRGTLVVALGDVAGKGLAAALLMAALRASVRALWLEPATLPHLVSRVNENLQQTLPPNRYATLFLARVEPLSGEVRYVNAGHAAPMLVRADGPPERLEVGGTILGALPSIGWEEGRVRLAPGDCLVILSDGVVDALGTGLTPEAVVSAVRHARGGDVPGLLAALQSAADAALGPDSRRDDHTFVVLRRLGQGV